MSIHPLPPNFVRRNACRTSCIATARSCVHHLPCHLSAIQRIISFVMERTNKRFARRPVPQVSFHVYPWQPPTAPLSAPLAAASIRRTLALRVSCTPSRPTSRARWGSLVVPCQVSAYPVLMGAFPASRRHVSLGTIRVHLVATHVLHLLTSYHGAQLKAKLSAFVVISKPLPRTEQFLLNVVHEFSHFILHVTCSLAFVVPFSILCFLLLFLRLELLLCPFSTVLPLRGNLTHPCSCSFPFLGCVVRTNTSVSMRACAFTLHPHSNWSRVDDRPCTRTENSWSSFTPSQPKHAQICHFCSRSWHGHDPRHALHSRVHF